MRVIIVGGGIGGLATAIALRKEGFEPIVLEQASSITPVGAGIHLYPNGMKVLDHLGIADRVRAIAVASEEEIYANLYTGERIAQRQLYGSGMAGRAGDFCYALHRAAFLDALLDGASGADIRLNSRVADFVQNDRGVCVRLDSGEEIEADLLIGADGLKSQVRTALFGYEPPHFMNYIGWRTVFPISALHVRPVRGFTIWIGLNRSVSFYPIGRDLMYLGSLVPAAKAQEESWTSVGVAENLATAFPGACDEVADAFEAVAKHAHSVTMTGYYYREPLSTWSQGRVTLLGDAAHPSPPAVGQGSGMALEDAVMLARTLRRHGPQNLNEALREYETRRTPRTAAMNLAARGMMNLQREDIDKHPEDQARAAFAVRQRYQKSLARLDPTGDITFGWLTHYDPVAASQISLEEERAISGQRQILPQRPEARLAYGILKDAILPDDRVMGPPGERNAYDRWARGTGSLSAHANVERINCDGVEAFRVGARSGPAIFFLHGGGYAWGSAESALPLAEKIANAVGGWALVPDYRLAPEHPWPCGYDDALTAYRWLIRHHPANQIVMSGECAGGGLALGLAVRLRDDGEPLPVGLHLLSPFLDLSLTGLSIERNAGRDPWFNRAILTQLSASYIPADTDPARPDISPLFAKLFGLPPLLLHLAADEALRDDAARLAIAARAEGIPITLNMVPDSVHAFMRFDALPETEQALQQIRAFAGEILARDPICAA